MGSMGSACVRDCVRSSHEYATEELLHSSTDVPGLSSSSSRAGAGPLGNLGKVGSIVPGLSLPNDGGPASARGPAVPPVPNWIQVFQPGRTKPDDKETPRFDEVLQSPHLPGQDQMTPRDNIGGEFRTPGPSPRDSPRPLDDVARASEISYEGTYLGTMKHGSGKLRMSMCTYEGEFIHDQKHGNGTLNWDDGRQYRGQFEYGKFHGAAVMTWPDGRRYVGNYIQDRKHGEGTFSWQDGRRYQGQWVCGKRHGIGIYTNAKGFTRRGVWQMDRPLQWEDPPPSVPASTFTSLRDAMDRGPHSARSDVSEQAEPDMVPVSQTSSSRRVSNL